MALVRPNPYLVEGLAVLAQAAKCGSSAIVGSSTAAAVIEEVRRLREALGEQQTPAVDPAVPVPIEDSPVR